MTESNAVLKRIMYQIYQKRPVMPSDYRTHYRIERVNGGLLCDLWFLTGGCSHDARGGCTMCNYGKSCEAGDWTQVLDELDRIVKRLPWEFEDFLLTPSGSMLDEREVPAEMYGGLADLLKQVHTKRFIVETRADTVTEERLERLGSLMPGADKYIEIGVESSNDWILKNCVNKGSFFRTFQEAVKRIHEKGFYVTANAGLGQPFLSERASVEDTVHTIKDVLKAGSDSVVLFPYHIKKDTLLEDMYENDMYDCVSLWSLTAVLDRFSDRELDKIQISWYKDYYGEERSFIRKSPGTCGKCYGRVMKRLDEYRNLQDPAIIRELCEENCSCKEKWAKRIASQSPFPELNRVEQMYRKLARRYGTDQELLEKQLEVMRQEYKEIFSK